MVCGVRCVVLIEATEAEVPKHRGSADATGRSAPVSTAAGRNSLASVRPVADTLGVAVSIV